jgi:hypothetical protein
VHSVDIAKEREERTFDNTPEAPGHGMHAEMRRSLAFSQDGDWLFAPDMHDRGVRLEKQPASGGSRRHEPLVERADDLRDSCARPDIEER